MGRLHKRAIERQTTIDGQHAERLLLPLALFLKIGGLKREDAEASFSAAYKKASQHKSFRFQHIGHHTCYQDIIALWMKDERFVSPSGQPKVLKKTGRNSFTTLIHEASPNSTVSKVLKIFLRYGNIKRTRTGRYRLIRRYFVSNVPGCIAFEPIAKFVADVSTTARHLLRKTSRPGGRSDFWQRVETTELSDGLAIKFLSFAKDRSLLFLEELDDWLDAHKDKARRKHAKRRRIGIGVFSVYSDPEVIDPKS